MTTPFPSCATDSSYLEPLCRYEAQKKCGRGSLLTAKGNFQASQTAKARLGSPRAVTPRRDETVSSLAQTSTARLCWVCPGTNAQ